MHGPFDAPAASRHTVHHQPRSRPRLPFSGLNPVPAWWTALATACWDDNFERRPMFRDCLIAFRDQMAAQDRGNVVIPGSPSPPWRAGRKA